LHFKPLSGTLARLITGLTLEQRGELSTAYPWRLISKFTKISQTVNLGRTPLRMSVGMQLV
jgi:hypothetical protein